MADYGGPLNAKTARRANFSAWNARVAEEAGCPKVPNRFRHVQIPLWIFKDAVRVAQLQRADLLVFIAVCAITDGDTRVAYRSGGLLKPLAKNTGITLPNVSRALKKLETLKVLVRRRKGRRLVAVVWTDGQQAEDLHNALCRPARISGKGPQRDLPITGQTAPADGEEFLHDAATAQSSSPQITTPSSKANTLRSRRRTFAAHGNNDLSPTANENASGHLPPTANGEPQVPPVFTAKGHDRDIVSEAELDDCLTKVFSGDARPVALPSQESDSGPRFFYQDVAADPKLAAWVQDCLEQGRKVAAAGRRPER
ncbi:MAG TPA: helix-turn-helix domain-containing protein [Elusimicrobiota bacterium]|nr:helix-turn-helix domain-containing protein [Elusimicrobiota bacterium]